MPTIKLTNINKNNLKNINLEIPIDRWITFVGKSGSGKSTLADVIFSNSLVESNNICVPVDVSIFRQKVSLPIGNQTIQQYLNVNQYQDNTYLIDIIKDHYQYSIIGNKNVILYAVEAFGLNSIKISTSLSQLSLTTFNKLRFIRFLLTTTAQLLIIDELASGMCFAEAKNVALVFRELTKFGYSIIAIEHSMPMIDSSDYIVEMGPGAGIEGGQIIYAGKTEDYLKTANYQNMRLSVSHILPANRIEGKHLKITDIDFHRLQLSQLSMPTNCIVNVCGIAASGKTTLLDIIFRAFDKSSDAWKNRYGINGEITGKSYIRRPHFVDQTPIGSNTMSTPATYTKIMDILRKLYAELPESHKHSYTVSDFSYNSKGACLNCGGKGCNEISCGEEAIYEPCTVCHGSRFRKEINEVLLDGLSIGDILQSSCGLLAQKWTKRTALTNKLNFIVDVGLSYLTLGQPAPSLSGGESQRIKITRELSKKLGDRSLFILDTPSKGLHSADFINLFEMLRILVMKNNSVLIADNNPFFIRNADWLIVLNDQKIVFEGYPVNLPPYIALQLGTDL